MAQKVKNLMICITYLTEKKKIEPKPKPKENFLQYLDVRLMICIIV